MPITQVAQSSAGRLVEKADLVELPFRVGLEVEPPVRRTRPRTNRVSDLSGAAEVVPEQNTANL